MRRRLFLLLTGLVVEAAATGTAIRRHPSDFYVNVHSTPGFEAGAIRGQLG